MKSLYLRSGLALACALGLAACGGSDDNMQLSGAVRGLTKDGLVIQNNGGPPLAIPANAGGFVFPELIGSDSDFNITIQTQPASSECKVINGKGKSGAYGVFAVEIQCLTFSFDLGGSITGLDSDGLVLINGRDRKVIPAGATTFTMTMPTLKADGKNYEGQVPDGQPYGITVFQQPAGRTCTVANGSGIMGGTARNDVVVTCV
ncbi:MAG TPA: hypothetical protein VGD30_14095 [Telluria sp.]